MTSLPVITIICRHERARSPLLLDIDKNARCHFFAGVCQNHGVCDTHREAHVCHLSWHASTPHDWFRPIQQVHRRCALQKATNTRVQAISPLLIKIKQPRVHRPRLKINKWPCARAMAKTRNSGLILWSDQAGRPASKTKGNDDRASLVFS